MTLDEIKLYARQERIKALIYFGVEAEIERIDNMVEKAALDPNSERSAHEVDWHDKQARIFDAKIDYVNARVEDLQVVVATEHG
jgi:hypothetical protein